MTAGGFGPYQTERLLGTGGTSQVWLAHGPDGAVALKVPRTEEHRVTLVNEARVLAELDVPGVARLVDADPDGSWIALELLDGEPFDAWAATRPIPAAAAAAADVADTLAALHERGTVHGDVKPSNVMVASGGRAVLVDMGLAGWVADERGRFRGTLGFSAPEVLSGGPVTPAADAWSLGALLYAALAGRVPFHAPDPAALAWLPNVTLPLPPSVWRADLPGSLDAIALDLVSRNPAGRPTVREAAQRLRSVEADASSPVLGMIAARDRIRRAIVEVADGRSRIVVLVGTVGSGRRTLAVEALEAARREGLGDRGASDRWAAVTADPNQAAAWAKEEGTHLILGTDSKPWPGVSGAEPIALPPLAERDVGALIRLAGGDPGDAPTFTRETLGHPASVHARLRAWVRQATAQGPDPEGLPEEALALHKLLRGGSIGIAEAAVALGVGEHDVLDRAEILIAGGLAVETDDGASLQATA